MTNARLSRLISVAEPAANRLPTLVIIFAVVTMHSVSTGDEKPQTSAPPNLIPVVSGPSDSVPNDPDADPFRRDGLATDDYQARQRATLEMWSDREQFREAVRRAVRDPDPEVANRARWVLDQWRKGILPNTPADLAGRLQRADQAGAIDLLLAAGHFAAASVALEESAGTPEIEAAKNRAARTLTRFFPFHVNRAVREESIDDLLSLIDLVADTPALAVSRMEMMQVLGHDLDAVPLLPSSADRWDEGKQLRAEVQVLFTLGRTEEAIRRARSAADGKENIAELGRELVAIGNMLHGRWEANCEELKASPPEPAQSVESQALHWSRLLVAADRCDDQQARQLAIDTLVRADWKGVPTSPPKDEADSPDFDNDSPRPNGGDHFPQRPKTATAAEVQRYVNQIRWMSLAVHGEVDSAIEILGEMNVREASHLARSAARNEAALRMLGVLPDSMDVAVAEQLETWKKPDDPDDIFQRAESIDRMLVLARNLLAYGRKDLARQICERMVTLDEPGEPVIRNALIGQLYAVDPNWAIEFAVDTFPPQRARTRGVGGDPNEVIKFATDGTQPDLPVTTARVLSRITREAGPSMWSRVCRSLRLVRPRSSLSRRLHWTRDLLEGQLPVGFSPRDDLDRLYAALKTSRESSRRPAGVRVPRPEVEPLTTDYADMFQRLGRADLATQCDRELAKTNSRNALDATFHLAESARQAGRNEASAEYYQIIQQGIDTRAERLGLAGGVASLMDLAVRLPVASWLSAKRSGDSVRRDQSARILRLILCSPDADDRQRLISSLEESGEVPMVEEGYRQLLMLVAWESGEWTTFSWVARSFATFLEDRQPVQAARWADLGVVASLAGSPLPAVYFLYPPIRAESHRLRAAIETRDEALAEQSIRRLLRLDPLEIDYAEGLLPKLREAGFETIANEAVEEIAKVARRHHTQFPWDPAALNNLAWVMAVNGRHLEEALTWSRRSVALEPDSVIYRDTLAEILFRLGHVDQAIQIEQACIIDDPGEHHLHEQLKRFREQK